MFIGQRNRQPVRVNVVAITSTEAKIGGTPELLRRRMGQQEGDIGERPSPASTKDGRIKAREREARELRKGNKIVRLAKAFHPGGAQPRFKSWRSSSTVFSCG